MSATISDPPATAAEYLKHTTAPTAEEPFLQTG